MNRTLSASADQRRSGRQSPALRAAALALLAPCLLLTACERSQPGPKPISSGEAQTAPGGAPATPAPTKP